MPVLRCDSCKTKLGRIEKTTKGEAYLLCSCGWITVFGSEIPRKERKKAIRKWKPKPGRVSFVELKASWASASDKALKDAAVEAELKSEKPPF